MRLLTSGAECGSVEELTFRSDSASPYGAAYTDEVVTDVVRPPLSQFAYHLRVEGANITWADYVQRMVAFDSSTEIYGRAAVYLYSNEDNSFPADGILTSAAERNHLITTDPLSIKWTTDNGLIKLSAWGDDHALGWIALSTATIGFGYNEWRVIEWHAQVSGSSLALVEVWVDDVEVVNWSSGITVSTTSFSELVVRAQTNGIGIFDAHFDDIAINDTSGSVNNGRCGRGTIVGLRPDGAGDSTMLTPIPTTPNWDMVNDLTPDDDTTYVESSTVGDLDLYTMEDLNSLVTGVNAAALYGRMKQVPGPAGFDLPVKSGGTESDGSVLIPSSTWEYRRREMSENPVTSAAWTKTEINAVQAGAKVNT